MSPEKGQRVEAVEQLLRETRGLSVRELALRVQLPKSTVYRILTTDLELSKKFGKWVPHQLTESNIYIAVLEQSIFSYHIKK
jgi:predicted transcriptional regulator